MREKLNFDQAMSAMMKEALVWRNQRAMKKVPEDTARQIEERLQQLFESRTSVTRNQIIMALEDIHRARHMNMHVTHYSGDIDPIYR